MKNLLTATILLAFQVNAVHAQKPSWGWGREITTNDNSNGKAKVFVSKSDELYMAGSFADSVVIQSARLISKGKKDGYLAKYNLAGQLIWTKQIGGQGEDEVNGIAEDQIGNLYLTGYFSDSVLIDGAVLKSSGAKDLFVLKFSPSGVLLWAHRAGGAEDDEPGESGGIAIDNKSNLILAGHYGETSSTSTSTAQFDSITLVKSGTLAMYIAKYDSSGRVIWAKKADDVRCVDVQCDSMNNYFAVGGFGNTAFFGSTKVTSNGNAIANMCLAKYDEQGTVQWVKTGNGFTNTTGLSELIGTNIVIDKGGNAYVSGWSFNCKIWFGGLSVEGTNGIDQFLVKYDSQGNPLWAKGFDGAFWKYRNGLACDAQSNLYLTGGIGPGTVIGNDTVVGNNLALVVCKFAPNGNPEWVVSPKGSGDAWGHSLVSDSKGRIFVTGGYTGTVDFSTSTLSNQTGVPKQFLARLDNSALSAKSIEHSAFVITPNPANSTLKVSKKGNLPVDLYTILSLTGQIVATGRFESDSDGTIDVSFLSTGTYLVMLSNQSGYCQQQKITIQH